MKNKTETKSIHTPTPWHLHDMENATICGPDHLSLCLCEARSRKPSENDANATFIVYAVNAHEPMLELLKTCLDHAQKRYGHVLPEFYTKVEETIAKAEGL